MGSFTSIDLETRVSPGFTEASPNWNPPRSLTFQFTASYLPLQRRTYLHTSTEDYVSARLERYFFYSYSDCDVQKRREPSARLQE